MEITLSSTVTDNPKDKKDMHYLWYKHGFTDRIMKSHINCHTYVRDSEGGGLFWYIQSPVKTER